MIQFLNKNNVNKGFSIIELIISIAILSLVGIAVVSFQVNIFSFNSTISNSLTAQQEARRTFKIMTAEIRSASCSNIGSYAISEASSTAFIFYSDIDNDRIREQVRYFLDGNIFKKGILKPTGSPLVYVPANEKVEVVIYNVVNGDVPVFQYYDANYDGTTPPLGEPVNKQMIRLVKATVIIDHDLARPPSPITITTQVSIRNLKDNL